MPSKADTQVKERPILFSSAMVKAILEGRKTQTRRVIKGIALEMLGDGFTPEYVADPGNSAWCPFGQAGDKLWVRETFHSWTMKIYSQQGYSEKPNQVVYRADGGTLLNGAKWQPSIFMPRHLSRITLEITKVRVERVQDISAKDVEAEGVIRYRRYPGQEGGFPDGWEDSRPGYGGSVWVPSAFKDAYRVLWDSINAKRGFGWKSNPWVWCIDFKKL